MNIQVKLTAIFCSLCLVSCNSLAPKSSPETVSDTQLSKTGFEPKYDYVTARHAGVAKGILQDDWLFPYKLEVQTPLIFRDIVSSYYIPPLAEVEAKQQTKPTAKSESKLDNSANNLWQYIGNGYVLNHVEHQDIDAAIERYVNLPNYFTVISTRAVPYLYYIVQEIEKRGLPLELALLPAVESSFEPTAYSSMSAAGIWQFTPSTGEYFGLKQDVWYDARRDIIVSTRAALDYLKYLHKFFDEDWLLAMAAYNYGEGNVRRAIRRNEANGKATDYWSLDLPAETRAFVPRILAVARAIVDAEKHGLEITYVANKPYLQTVEVDKQMDLSVAAKFAGLSTHEFKRLNPGYKRAVTGPDGPHQLALPVHKVADFKYQLAKVNANSLLPKPELARLPTESPTEGSDKSDSFIHTVQSGESLWAIARQYQVSVANLARWNNISARHTLRSGQKLSILSIGD